MQHTWYFRSFTKRSSCEACQVCNVFFAWDHSPVAMPSMPNSFRVYSSALIFCLGVSSAVRSPEVVDDADLPQESPGQKSQYLFPEATLVSEGEEEYVFMVNAMAFVNLDTLEEWVVYASSDCRGEELARYQVARWISNQTAQVWRTCADGRMQMFFLFPGFTRLILKGFHPAARHISTKGVS